MAVLHRLHGATSEAAAAATEALELYRAGGPRRFRNRVDPRADLRGRRRGVLRRARPSIAAEAGDPERAARLLGQAERLRGDAGRRVPGVPDATTLGRADAAIGALGPTASGAFELGGSSADAVALRP